MIIQSLKLTNFRHIQGTKEFTFKEITRILGHNRSGKTTLAHGIVFTLFGMSFHGDSQRLEDIINLNCGHAETDMTFLDDAGRSHRIIRNKNHHSQTVTLDGNPTTQTAINQLVGEPDLFLSIFNPVYFMEVLESKDRRPLFYKYSPVVDMVQLFNNRTGRPDLISKYQVQISKKTDYTRINKQKNDVEREINELRTKVSLLTQQNIASPTDSVSEIDEEEERRLLAQVEQYITAIRYNSELNSQISIYNNTVEQYNNIMSQITEKRKQIEEATWKGDVPTGTDNDPQYLALQEEERNLHQQIQNPPAFVKFEQIAQCPTCYAYLSDEHKQFVVNYQQQEVQRIHAHNEAIRQRIEAVRAQLEVRKEQIAAVMEPYNQANLAVSKLNSEIAGLQCSLPTLPPRPESQYIDVSQYEEVRQRYQAVVAANQELRMKNAQIREVQRQVNERADLIYKTQMKIDEAVTRHAELSIISEALSPKGIFREAIEQKVAMIKNELRGCDIVLEKENKDGEIVECFEIFYEGKPYRTLSTSERVLCSLEIAHVLREYSGKDIPSFVDNAESISNIPKELIDCSQVFLSTVVPDQPLLVQV